VTRLAILLATCFGIGRIPGAPGTAASLAALPLACWLGFVGGWPALLGAAIAATLIGIWACGLYAMHAGLKDPSPCVLDEVAGQWLTLLPLALYGELLSVVPLLLAFALFRFFDILKPFPIARLEGLPGGLGVMADDILAGLMGAGVLWAALAWNVL
jgi:phosphatidylglycerophosphatase A